MLEKIYSICFLFGMFSIIFLCPYKLRVGIEKIVYDKVGIVTRIIGLIPVVSVISSDITYFGKPKFASIGNTLFAASLGFRLYAAYNVVDKNISMASVIAVVAAFILMWLSNFYIVWTILTDSGYSKVISKIILALFWPIGMYFIGTLLSNVISHNITKENSYL